VKPAVASQSLLDCVNKRSLQWSKDSLEYKYRLYGVLQMPISTGYPVTMVDEADYRESMRQCDPKFVLPGRLYDLGYVGQWVP